MKVVLELFIIRKIVISTKMKITKEILEDTKKWYLEGNSIRKTTKLIFQKYGTKIGETSVNTTLKNIMKLRNKKQYLAIKRGNFLNEQEIVKLYTKKLLSLKQIARMFNASPSGIKWILLKNSVQLRDKRDGLLLVKGKYEKPPFKGSEIEESYLIGIVLGDLHSRWNSRYTIEVNTSSTHEKFIELLKKLFSKYTDGIVIRPRNKDELRFYAYLDRSFDFLIKKKEQIELIKEFNQNEFLSFLAGFFDAEGCIVKGKHRKSLRCVIKIGNTNKEILEIIKDKLENLGIYPKLYLYSKAGKYHYYDGRNFINRKPYYVLEIGRKEEILKLLSKLNLKHEEKIVRKIWAIKFLTCENIVDNYYFSLLYQRLRSLRSTIKIKNFAQKNSLKYPIALMYLLHNVKRGFIQKEGKKYIVSGKGKDFIEFYEKALKKNQN